MTSSGTKNKIVNKYCFKKKLTQKPTTNTKPHKKPPPQKQQKTKPTTKQTNKQIKQTNKQKPSYGPVMVSDVPKHIICANLNLLRLFQTDMLQQGAGRSSEVERSLMVRWVVGSILHGVDPLSYFSFQPVLHDWCNKGRGMCYPVCGMVHIKEPLLLIGKSSLCGGSGFPFSLSEWSLTICLTPYNRR